MSDDNTQGAAEPSPASGGSHGPVAWAILHKDHQYVSLCRKQAEAHNVYTDAEIVPLYAGPMLTDADRDALRGIAEALRRLRVYPEQLGRTQQDDVDLLFRVAGVG